MSDEDEGTLVHGPWSDDSYVPPPPIPDYTDIPRPEPAPENPPESANETTTEIPRLPGIPAAPDPAMALRSEGIPESAEYDGGEYEEYEDGEYVQPRSLADRLGDWLELRLEMARTRHESEAPFREAEIARKAALLKSRTEQEVALAAANSKLRQAQLTHGDRSGAHTKSTGSGGGGRGAGGGGRGSGGGSGRSGGGRGSGSGASPRSGSGSGSGRGGGPGSGRGSGGGSSTHGSGKGPGGGSGGRGGGPKGNDPKRDSKGRQNGSGGLGASGKGGGGSGGVKSGSGGGRSPARREERALTGHRTDGPAGAAPATTRAERKGARQQARLQRAAARQQQRLADRGADRAQDRAHRDRTWEDTRAAGREREAARRAEREERRKKRRARREADRDARTTFGQAVGEEAARRWEQRRAGDPSGAPKVNLTKDKKDKAEDAEDKGKKKRGAADKDKSSAGDGKEPGSPAGEPGRYWDAFAWRRFFYTRSSRRRRERARERGWPWDPFAPESPTYEATFPGRSTRPRPPHGGEEFIPDADLIPDDPLAVTTGTRSLPPAPEPRFARPGTSKPTPTPTPTDAESPVPGTEEDRMSSGSTGAPVALSGRHRTDITFGQYLTEIVNIAIAAGLDKDRAQDLAVALGKVADAMRDMAADLVGDHNIATEVVDQITDLADAADRMKRLAERCATECEIASEAALLAARSVGRVYGEDIQAMDDAGLAHASSAAHHD